MTIRNDILVEVKKVGIYSVIADEVIDVANKEMLSLTPYYVHDGVICEVFMDL